MKPKIIDLLSITEVFPDTKHSILVFLSICKNGRYCVHSEKKLTEVDFTSPRTFKKESIAKAEFELLIWELRHLNPRKTSRNLH